MRDPRHVQQPLIPEELGPTPVPGVRLIEAADEGVTLVAVGVGSYSMQLCKQFGGVPFGPVGEAAASLYELHQ